MVCPDPPVELPPPPAPGVPGGADPPQAARASGAASANPTIQFFLKVNSRGHAFLETERPMGSESDSGRLVRSRVDFDSLFPLQFNGIRLLSRGASCFGSRFAERNTEEFG